MNGSPVLISFRFLSLSEICRIFGSNPFEVDFYVRSGLIPEPYMLGDNICGWRSDEIEETISLMISHSEYRMYEQYEKEYNSNNEDD